MWSAHVHVRAETIAVNVNRWERNSPYPTVLFDFELLRTEGESELATLERVFRAARQIAEVRRHER